MTDGQPGLASVPAGFRSAYDASRPGGPYDQICYAPSSHLYFGHRGRVVACCYNRLDVLGVYPQQSVREIWFGNRIAALRQRLLDGDLGGGCNACRTQILSHNYEAVHARSFDSAAKSLGDFPSVMSFELDNTCNLECSMCSGEYSSLIRRNREGLPPIDSPYDGEFVHQLEEFLPTLKEAKFLGGEPFLIPIYQTIWESMARVNPEIDIHVQTNGTILSDRARRTLESGRFHISVSLDSLDPETYGEIRVNGRLDEVIGNLRVFASYCQDRGTFFGISVCAMRRNWQEIPEIVRYCNEVGARLYINTVHEPYSQALWNLERPALEEMVNSLAAVQLPRSSIVEDKNRSHFEGWVRQLIAWSKVADGATLSPPRGDLPGSDEVPSAFETALREHLQKTSNLDQNALHEALEGYFAKVRRFLGHLPAEYPAQSIFDAEIEYLHSVLEGLRDEDMAGHAARLVRDWMIGHE